GRCERRKVRAQLGASAFLAAGQAINLKLPSTGFFRLMADAMPDHEWRYLLNGRWLCIGHSTQVKNISGLGPVFAMPHLLCDDLSAKTWPLQGWRLQDRR